MSIEHTVSTIEDLFATSCVELFQGLGCAVSVPDTAGFIEGAPVAHIDAGSDDLELTIVLKVPHSVLSLSYPDADNIVSLDDAKLEDWISELSNQLVGKLKNKLLELGCRIKIGLPTSFFDAEDEVEVQGDYCTTYQFDIDSELLECSLYLDVHNMDIVLADEPVMETASEGELELF